MKKLFKLYFIDLYIPFIYVKDFNYLIKMDSQNNGT